MSEYTLSGIKEFRGMEGTELDAEDLRILHALTTPAASAP